MATEQTVVIKDLHFWYNKQMDDPFDPDKKVVVEQLAYRGDEVTLTSADDIRRGEENGSFMSEEEQAAYERDPYNPSFSSERPEETDPDAAPAATGTGSGGAARPDLSTASVDDVSAWISAEKPTVSEMLDLANSYSDDDSLNKLLEAEAQATGDESRKGVVEGVAAIAERNAQ
jgi:hypothetical protein